MRMGNKVVLVVALAAVVLLAAAVWVYSAWWSLGGLIGSEAAEVIEESGDWVLVSLYPYDHVSEKDNPGDWHSLGLADRPMFGNLHELGRVKLNAGEVEKLRASLIAGIREVAGDEGDAKCWWPRHALVMEHGGQSHTLTICFQCAKATMTKAGGIRVSSTPAKAFNEVLDEHGILREGK